MPPTAYAEGGIAVFLLPSLLKQLYCSSSVFRHFRAERTETASAAKLSPTSADLAAASEAMLQPLRDKDAYCLLWDPGTLVSAVTP